MTETHPQPAVSVADALAALDCLPPDQGGLGYLEMSARHAMDYAGPDNVPPRLLREVTALRALAGAVRAQAAAVDACDAGVLGTVLDKLTAGTRDEPSPPRARADLRGFTAAADTAAVRVLLADAVTRLASASCRCCTDNCCECHGEQVTAGGQPVHVTSGPAAPPPSRQPEADLAALKADASADLARRIAAGEEIDGQVLPPHLLRIEVTGRHPDSLQARVFYPDRAPFYLQVSQLQDPARAWARDEIADAIAGGLGLAVTGLGLGERDSDLAGVILNTSMAVLDDPHVTLDQVLDANYDGGAAKVRGWWGGWS